MRLSLIPFLALAFLSGCSDEELYSDTADTAVESTIPDEDEGAVDGRPQDNDDDGDGRRDDDGTGSSDTDGNGGTDTDSGESQTWYADCDGDGYGVIGYTRNSSTMPSGDSCDDGGDWVLVAGDCSDSNASAFPGNSEVSDGVDNDCDGTIDEGSSSSNTWYYDGDGDGYGLSSVTSSASVMPSGYTAVGGDCNDSNASAHPGGSEGTVADGIDQDCDGTPDDGTGSGSGDLATWYADCDCDGWGADGFTRESAGEPDGDSCSAGGCWSEYGGDCEDSNSSLNPDDGCDEGVEICVRSGSNVAKMEIMVRNDTTEEQSRWGGLDDWSDADNTEVYSDYSSSRADDLSEAFIVTGASTEACWTYPEASIGDFIEVQAYVRKTDGTYTWGVHSSYALFSATLAGDAMGMSGNNYGDTAE